MTSETVDNIRSSRVTESYDCNSALGLWLGALLGVFGVCRSSARTHRVELQIRERLGKGPCRLLEDHRVQRNHDRLQDDDGVGAGCHLPPLDGDGEPMGEGKAIRAPTARGDHGQRRWVGTEVGDEAGIAAAASGSVSILTAWSTYSSGSARMSPESAIPPTWSGGAFGNTTSDTSTALDGQRR
jgi:hypothetical protein